MAVTVVLLAEFEDPADSALVPIGSSYPIGLALSRLRGSARLANASVVVVTTEASRSAACAAGFGADQPEWLTVGTGTSRHSCLHGVIDYFAEEPGDRIVVLHDVTRPLAPDDIIRQVIAAAEQTSEVGAAPVVAVVETVKSVGRDGRIIATLPREELVRVQFPQAAQLKVLREVHSRCPDGADVLQACLVGPTPVLVDGSGRDGSELDDIQVDGTHLPTLQPPTDRALA